MGGGSLFQVGEDVEFWRVLIHLSILAFCLVLFEGGLHKLEHKFPPSEKYQHMLKKAYRELMVLGLISLGLKILKELPDIDSYSKTMLAFQNDRAERAELITTQDLVNSVNGSKGSDDAMPSFFQTLFCCGRSAKKRANDRELVELRLLRRLFLHRFGLPQLFPYSKYLNRAQANQIAHMIEVEPAMWIVLLIVAWAICGLLEILKTLDTDMPESHELVESFMMFAWGLLLLHVMMCLYFRSCVHHLLHSAAFSNDKATLVANLNAIADEEAEAWKNEEADKALEVMGCIQEHHEELELQRERNKKAGVGHLNKRRDSFSGVMPGSPSIEIRFFSHKGWHIGVMLLLILNGFLITLFVQCAFYDMDDIYEDFGTLPTVMVPLPLVINAVILQRHIFYDFVVVSNTLRIDSHTLSDVVENFSEVVHLRSEFATTLLNHITQQELAISDLQAELKARDRTSSGFIEVDDLRDVLSKFGFRLTRYRFNSVVKLLFELEGTAVAYSNVVRLVLMAQNENLFETMSVRQQQPHPLLRPSDMMYDDLGQSSMRSQSNYNIFNSTRQVPVMAPPSMDEPNPSDFVTVAMSSNILPQFSHRGANGNAVRPSKYAACAGISAALDRDGAACGHSLGACDGCAYDLAWALAQSRAFYEKWTSLLMWEISDAVVTQAADYFQYEWCSRDDEEDECPKGRTFVMDGLKFLASKPEDLGVETEEENPYDLFIVDVYTGWNPFAFFVREEMLRVRDNWLTTDGVLVMNFVGYMQDPRAAAPKSIYRTLQSVFKHVKCFREMEEPDEPEAANIVFYASDKPFDFNLPSTGMYKNPPAHTFFSVVKNFPDWEIFTELRDDVEVAIHQEVEDEEVRFVSSNDDHEGSAAPRVLTEADHGQEDFLPPSLWEEFKQKPSTTPTK
ncbi:S-adenosyl-L-methionine-dependent methyltransferase [Phytophthora cactorum]|nr:S-adenosyl-L-methionine-dependent methyltransferase [Phytophthora cactorum]